MARKRIKTLAKEWGVPLEDVIASSERLQARPRTYRREPARRRKRPIGSKPISMSRRIAMRTLAPRDGGRDQRGHRCREAAQRDRHAPPACRTHRLPAPAAKPGAAISISNRRRCSEENLSSRPSLSESTLAFKLIVRFFSRSSRAGYLEAPLSPFPEPRLLVRERPNEVAARTIQAPNRSLRC